MLFDLRSPSRRRAIKIIYSLLAVLMAVGLVGFGIGGSVSGGLADGLGGCGSQDANQQLKDDASAAQKRVDQQPQNAAAWGALVRARYQLVAATNDLYDSTNGQFTAKGKQELANVASAYDQYLELTEKPSVDIVRTMVQTFIGLEKLPQAVEAQQILTEADPSPNAFFQLAVYAYAAQQTRTAELAARKALELTPKDNRKIVKERLESAKQDALQRAVSQQVSGASAPAGGGAPPSG